MALKYCFREIFENPMFSLKENWRFKYSQMNALRLATIIDSFQVTVDSIPTNIYYFAKLILFYDIVLICSLRLVLRFELFRVEIEVCFEKSQLLLSS